MLWYANISMGSVSRWKLWTVKDQSHFANGAIGAGKCWRMDCLQVSTKSSCLCAVLGLEVVLATSENCRNPSMATYHSPDATSKSISLAKVALDFSCFSLWYCSVLQICTRLFSASKIPACRLLQCSCILHLKTWELVTVSHIPSIAPGRKDYDCPAFDFKFLKMKE